MCPYLTKGTIHELEHGDWITSGRFQFGNANKTGDVDEGPSSLFFVRDGYSGIGLAYFPGTGTFSEIRFRLQ